MAKKKTSKSAAKKSKTIRKTAKPKAAKKQSVKKSAKKAAAKTFKSFYSAKELGKIRKALVRRKAQILEELMNLRGQSLNKSIKDSSGDLSSYTFHMADMASDLYDREFMFEMADNDRQRLLALDDAIQRVDEGSYGRCDMCGCNIPKSRLEVMPQAEYCFKCQEESEKQ